MAVPSPDPDRSGQILDAASRVFARLGFGSARMEDVAAESGLSKGAVYLYFRSKDQLIDALVGRIVSFETRRLREIARGEGSARERLLQFGDEYGAELIHLGPLARMVPEVYARALRHPRVLQAFQGYLNGFRVELEALIADGISRGEFRVVDPGKTALAITGLLEGLALLWLLDPQQVPVPELDEFGLGLMLDGLRAGAQPPAASGAAA